MYNEELEKLIDYALEDGELTEKEKQILFKKAELMGVDLDEFEVVLDARLHRVQKEKPAQPVASAPKSNKFGDVRKCPACGAILQSFQTVCPDCGHSFSGVDAVKSAQKLFDALQAAELRKTEQLAKQNEEKQRRLSELSQVHLSELSQRHKSDSRLVKLRGEERAEELQYEREELIKELDAEYKNLEKKLNAERANIIRTFPVPNSKEDLLELLAMATSNAYDNDGKIGFEEEVWIQKTDQIYQKVIACSDNDPQLLEKATTMILSLRQRLPKAYRNFTKLPQSIQAKMDTEKKAENERKRASLISSMKKYGIWGGLCLLIGIVLLIIGIGVTTIIGLVFIAAALVCGLIIRREYKHVI